MALEGYIVEIEDYQKLIKIKQRLYDDKPLTGDQRRDLANHMDAVLHHFMEVR